MTWIPRTAINQIPFNLMYLCLYMGIEFPYLSECHRQISFLESMSLDDVLCQLVLKENKTKVLIAQSVMGPSKQLKQIIQIEHNIVKNPNNEENLYIFF